MLQRNPDVDSERHRRERAPGNMVGCTAKAWVACIIWIRLGFAAPDSAASGGHPIQRPVASTPSPAITAVSANANLVLGEPIFRHLAGGEQHVHRLSLNAGQFARLTIDPTGIELTVSVVGPDGLQINKVSCPYAVAKTKALFDGNSAQQARRTQRYCETAEQCQHRRSSPARHMQFSGCVVLVQNDYLRSAGLDGLQVVSVKLLPNPSRVLDCIYDFVLLLAHQCSGNTKEHDVAKSVGADRPNGEAGLWL